MDTKTLVKALKVAVREVIQEELTQILREGLQSTITEMAQPRKQSKANSNKIVHTDSKPINNSVRNTKVKFNENKWASILNETDSLLEQDSTSLSSFRDMMNEGMDEIRMTSRDAVNFGVMRQNMKESMGVTPAAPKIMEDPETGKIFDVPVEVQQAMTRDYSSLMKAINKKKGM
jgi:hypothetical protein